MTGRRSPVEPVVIDVARLTDAELAAVAVAAFGQVARARTITAQRFWSRLCAVLSDAALARDEAWATVFGPEIAAIAAGIDPGEAM